MKRIFLVLALSLIVVSCKNNEEKQSESTDEATQGITGEDINIKNYKGEFLYLADGAVLKGNSFIYGVTLNEKAKELAEKVKPVKVDSFDMVPVFVKGSVSKKAAEAEGWEEIITIVEIINVGKKPAEADIKFEEKKS
jgi:hypothetical protein